MGINRSIAVVLMITSLVGFQQLCFEVGTCKTNMPSEVFPVFKFALCQMRVSVLKANKCKMVSLPLGIKTILQLWKDF